MPKNGRLGRVAPEGRSSLGFHAAGRHIAEGYSNCPWLRDWQFAMDSWTGNSDNVPPEN